jgi:hypothetical protein
MARIVINVFGGCRPPKKKDPARFFTLRWHGANAQSFIEGLMARITTEQQVTVSVAPKTLAGRPAAIDGDVAFTSSDELVATVTATGPLSALVKAVGPGVAQIVAKFDADLDDGEVREVTASGAIEVVAAEAETAEIVFGAPELTPLV